MARSFKSKGQERVRFHAGCEHISGTFVPHANIRRKHGLRKLKRCRLSPTHEYIARSQPNPPSFSCPIQMVLQANEQTKSSGAIWVVGERARRKNEARQREINATLIAKKCNASVVSVCLHFAAAFLARILPKPRSMGSFV